MTALHDTIAQSEIAGKEEVLSSSDANAKVIDGATIAPADVLAPAPHTPGPWEPVPQDQTIVRSKGPAPWVFVCDCHGVSNSEATALANARVIVTAVNCHSDLLAIAERWVALEDGSPALARPAVTRADLLAETRAAIARAAGEA